MFNNQKNNELKNEIEKLKDVVFGKKIKHSFLYSFLGRDNGLDSRLKKIEEKFVEFQKVQEALQLLLDKLNLEIVTTDEDVKSVYGVSTHSHKTILRKKAKK